MKLVITLILLFHICIFADDHTNARGTGMSRASMISSVGIDAFGINPANYNYTIYPEINLTSRNRKIKFPDPTNWNVSILSVGGTYGSDSNISFYNNYLSYLSVNRNTFTGLFTDLVSVLNFRNNVLPAERTQVNYDFELKWLSLNVSDERLGGFNFTITDKVGLNTNALGKDEAMPLNFNYEQNFNTGQFAFTNVQINQAEATAWWLRKYTVGYAKKFDFKKGIIKSLALGFSGGLVHGFGNIITYNSSFRADTYGISASHTSNGKTFINKIEGYQDFRTQAALTDFFVDYIDGAEPHFTFFPKPAGKGYTFDFGLTMQVGDNFTVAASVVDAGSINWNYNTFINYDTEYFDYDSFYVDPADPVYNQFVNDLEGLDTRDTLTSYTTSMSTKYRAGILYKHSDRLMVEANFIKGDNDMPCNANANVYAVGAEYFVLPFLPLRTGFSYGGPGEWYAALGAGLRFKNFMLDVGTNGINQLITNSRFSFALSSKIIL
jgi:hypothetical protein